MSPIAASHSESALVAPSSASDDAAASTGAIEPPDSLHTVSAALRSLSISAPPSSATDLCDASKHNLGLSYPPPAPATQLAERHVQSVAPAPTAAASTHSTSPASRYGRHFAMSNSSSVDSQLNYDSYLVVPASPSMSEGLTDSPGSVSSMSSFRRGDLADIEDLDLEPELETVSECDEESSSLCSLDIGIDLDSDSERASSHGGDHDHLPLSLSSSHPPRNAAQRSGSQPTAASDYARRKRSEWLLNNYANKIAARRPRRVKKGRISEIVEEGGEAINTTVMPKAPFASGASDWSCDVSGPPIAPPRSVSPSDSVPAIPSPLCSCVSVDGAPSAGTSGLEESVETIQGDSQAVVAPISDKDLSALEHEQQDTNAKPAEQSDYDDLEPPSKPETETSPPRLSRSSSRRNSSPVKLRPCFRRQSSHQSAASTRESSCERDPPRGRSVRFSSRPPQEMRTHSPVEYDRKSCPVNNRLSPADVEELRTMKMEMGLLEARWAAVAACKPRKVQGTEGTTKPENHNAYNAGVAAMSASRERRPACGAESDSTLGPGSMSSPAARLRQQKERERQQERQRNLPHYMRNRASVAQPQTEPLSSEALSIRSKFGHAPPPPLPGLPAARAPSVSPSRSTSVPPRHRSAVEEVATPRRLSCQSISTSGTHVLRPADIPVLTQTSPSPPSSPRSSFTKDSLSSIGLPERGRSGSCAAPPMPSPWSSGPSSTTSSIYSSTYFPSASASPAPCVSYAGSNGYDSPASEFYESGSEYDMVC
ncbi:uncharacterized protein UMAG_04079 [Mycosarcoma maydis]|uniref:Uncharacterized protein n=1 Tax=Mycosarcoma maydis TaxID=5270 RepID=A0A0D1C2T1_MYCMD|nr:uncharacterized protein UMAG_04079 [Ustilago maydis 521]KIS68037.1 hypothetical protein UMAG_04079 [Ustilago maydis 521]|eukprot:XP_011390513.1 hypothetical protein UMAG_04079 [Ustilago maydis 521]